MTILFFVCNRSSKARQSMIHEWYIYTYTVYIYSIYIYTVIGMRPVSPLENVFTGAIWVFGCCFFLPRRCTQMTVPLKVRAALKRIFDHNHPVSNWKERIHYGGPLKSWLNSPYLRFGGKGCCIAQQFWCICLHFAISSISLENSCKLFRYRAFCGKMLLNLTWKHRIGVQSTNLGLCQVEKYSLCPVYAMYEATCQFGKVWRKLLVWKFVDVVVYVGVSIQKWCKIKSKSCIYIYTYM